MTIAKPAVARTLPELRRARAAWRHSGERVALVPTMGALHAGHLDIVGRARRIAGRVVVSIFVNPRQFAPHEDLDRYPRDEAGDLAKLASAGADLVWAPDASVMYPSGFATRIEPQGAALGLETDFRPHFFGGVTTVVAKLFNQVVPDIALFGEKDFQQLAVIRQMVRDLDMNLEIAGVPTVREADGLALSSRNAYLTPAERGTAWMIEKYVEDHLYWVVMRERWQVRDNFEKGPKHFFDALPAALRPVVIAMVGREFKRNLWGQGMGRHSMAEMDEIAARGIKGLSDCLGDKPFLMGNAPCGADASVWSAMLGVLCPLFESATRSVAEAHPNLVAYAERGRALWFPDLLASV